MSGESGVWFERYDQEEMLIAVVIGRCASAPRAGSPIGGAATPDWR
jgi:hypothetical protein